jgi:hypothetical protein
MQLVMKQADTIYAQKTLEAKHLDDERSREAVDVCVSPTGETAPNNLTITVHNRCELNVKIIRIWVNDTIHPLEKVIQSMSEEVLASINVGPKDGSSYDTLVTTERGNVFESGSGPIAFEDGMWKVENKMINVLVSSSGVIFKIYVTLPDQQPHPDSPATVWKIGGSAFKSFDITNHGNGVYNVQVKKGSKTIHYENVTMSWPNGPPVIWVYS